MSTWNPRYLAYCTAHDTSDPDTMLEADRTRWPGGNMVGFMVWIGERWAAWYAATGERPECGTHASPRQHVAFDAWLCARSTDATTTEDTNG